MIYSYMCIYIIIYIRNLYINQVCGQCKSTLEKGLISGLVLSAAPTSALDVWVSPPVIKRENGKCPVYR